MWASQTQTAVRFEPVVDVTFPHVDLAGTADPVASILQAPEFEQTKRFFAEDVGASRSLLSIVARALLYATVRNLEPEHVVEIGTYKGGTAEVLARALLANGHGMLHTVSPYDAERLRPVLAQWPSALRAHATYYPVNSMAFFIRMAEQRVRPGVVLVDGNHDYEFAAFDIWSAARWMTPGGFIFIDNVAQAGPYRAAMDFMAARPAWRSCGTVPGAHEQAKAFDRDRTRVLDADFFVLRAPLRHVVGKLPETFGEIGWDDRPVRGLAVMPAKSGQTGTLMVQCILRAFSEKEDVELVADAACPVDGNARTVEVRFATPLCVKGKFDVYRVEPWLCWRGEEPLELESLPVPL
jgi:predicted O-methyltransferase YrrM